MTAALAARASTRRAINPWLVAMAVVVPTFMEVLDTTVANVALRYIAGGLSASAIDGEWVITSYLAANAFVLPITGWLSAHVGRRNYFLLSIAVFTVASVLCGLATTLEELVLFRVVQGLAGGGLQPSSQAILLDTFPREKQGAAMTMFGVAALIGPVVGPTLGGWLVVQYDWHWIFYINLPIGLLGIAACWFVLEDPPYLQQQREELKKRVFQFDHIGLGLLAVTMSSWEVMLSKGQEWDWLSDPFWRVQTLLALFVLGLGGLLFRELRIEHPVIEFRVLRERNLATCCAIVFSAFAVLYAGLTQLPELLQTLLGYDAYVSGLVLSPAGVFSILMMLVVGALLGRGVDARWLIAAGLLVVAAGNYWLALLNLEIGPWQFVWPRVVVIVGLALIFAPLNVAAYLYTPAPMRGAAVGLLALLRNEGGSFGTSMAQTIQERREQFHTLRLGESLDRFDPGVAAHLEQVQSVFQQHTADPVAAKGMALQALADLQQQQASSLAYFDVYWLSAVLSLVLLLGVLCMKRSVADKDAHAMAE